MNYASPKGFDGLLKSMFSHHTNMARHFNAIKKSLPLFRRDAYRFALDLINIRKHHSNQFIDYVKTNSVDVDVWMDQHFDTVEQLGEDRMNLMRCIEEGMTEKEYVAQFTLWGAKKRMATPSRTAVVDVQAVHDVTADMTDAERAEHYKKLCNELVEQVVQLQKDNTLLVTELKQLQKDVARAKRIFEGKKKKTA